MKNKKEIIFEIEDEFIYSPKVFFIEKNEGEKESILFIPNEKINIFQEKKYKNFKFIESSIISEEHKDFKVLGLKVVGNTFSLKIIEVCMNELGMSLSYTFEFLSNEFKKEKQDYLKFRGDLAESIFIAQNFNAIKIFEGASADIKLNENLIEIKSFSSQKRSIIVSMLQANENTIKYAIKLEVDINGESITTIANKFKNNIEFKEYLIQKYKDTPFDILKYKMTTPIDMTNKIPKIKLTKNIISAFFTILIDF